MTQASGVGGQKLADERQELLVGVALVEVGIRAASRNAFGEVAGVVAGNDEDGHGGRLAAQTPD